MALMITLDDVMKVLISEGFLAEEWLDEEGGLECVRNELEQKCYMKLNGKEKKIQEKEVEMPVLVLNETCRDCERLDIAVKTDKIFADGECVNTLNNLRCINVYECKKYAELARKIIEE